MKELVVHPATEEQVRMLSQHPGHAIILVGPTGSGKRTLAEQLLASILGIDNYATYPYVKLIQSEDNKTIGIEAVRELEQFLSLKVPNNMTYNRAVLIENAQDLSHEAQNALLKTLEEPPAGTVLVLTVNNAQALLPTIRSRSQTIHLNRPSKQALQTYFAVNEELVNKAYAISGGLPGLMHSLLAEEDHPLLQATTAARSILTKDSYDRLLMVDELAKNKGLTQDTVFILQQMAHAALQNGQAAQKWQRVFAASYEAAEQLAGNAQSKLILTKLMLSL